MAEILPLQQSERSSRLRARVETARGAMREALQAGAGRGACAALSDVYDGILSELWAEFESRGGDAATAELALVATGGWGRRELCPFSDIDFILLSPPGREDVARELADALLYPLWDARIQVGHAVRIPKEAARLARDDLATGTALLDVRYLVGARERLVELERGTRRAVAPGGNPNDFIEKLAEEKRRRHDRFGDSLYLLEPNLKQGIGALRDLATAVWAAKARWNVRQLPELVTQGQLSSRQVALLEDGLDFLLRLRSLLQLLANRPTDQLTFEIQETLAPGLYPEASLPPGDIRPAVAPAVEALMRHYYLHARSVQEVTDRLLESARVPARKRPRIRRIDHTFLTFNGQLAVRDPRQLREQPAEMLRIFRVALELDVPIYGHTKELIAENVAAAGSELTGESTAAQIFLEMLTDPRDRRQPSLLEEAHQLGLLNVVMPEWAPCTCRVQHDLYHVYTVDQHQLYTVAMLKRLARGELADAYPTATAAIAALPPSPSLYLGALLHDVGKPLGKGHAEKGAQLTSAIGHRLGMSTEAVEMATFLVRQHLTMSHVSQRRDLSDPAVIARFAERVGSEQHLVQLYLVTLCDTAMTAPGNLNAWKNELLRELFVRTRDALRGGVSADESRSSEQARRARSRVVALLSAESSAHEQVVTPEQAHQELEAIDGRFFAALTPRQLARLVRLAWQHRASSSAAELAVSCYPLKGHSEIAVVADDVRGLLSAIAGVLAANRIDVLGAVLGPRKGDEQTGQALDLFFVRDLAGNAIATDDARWQRVRQDLHQAIAGGAAGVERLIAKRRPRSIIGERITPAVPTEINVLNEASDEATVLEIFTRDRPGVLYAITRVLSDNGFDIALAKLSSEGEKVTDAFYITTGEGRHKVTDAARLAALVRELEVALAETAAT